MILLWFAFWDGVYAERWRREWEEADETPEEADRWLRERTPA